MDSDLIVLNLTKLGESSVVLHTISREYGAGGTSIGRRVAKELGIEIYDRDIIRSTVLKTGLDAGVIEHEEEEISRGDAFLRMITPAAYFDRREAIREIEREVILGFARKGACVLLGRCADIILEEGLEPADRAMVHLSATFEDALHAGEVRIEDPIILGVDTDRCAEEGFPIGKAAKTVYLCDRVPADCIFVSEGDEEE